MNVSHSRFTELHPIAATEWRYGCGATFRINDVTGELKAITPTFQVYIWNGQEWLLEPSRVTQLGWV